MLTAMPLRERDCTVGERHSRVFLASQTNGTVLSQAFVTVKLPLHSTLVLWPGLLCSWVSVDDINTYCLDVLLHLTFLIIYIHVYPWIHTRSAVEIPVAN
jgi:hypothetical protein